MKILNYTGHKVTILDDNNNVVQEYPSLGNIRVNQTTIRDIEFDFTNYPISHTTFGKAEMPPQIDGTYYIVSSIVRQAYPDRDDLLIVSETVSYKLSNGSKAIYGCHSLDRKEVKPLIIYNGWGSVFQGVKNKETYEILKRKYRIKIISDRNPHTVDGLESYDIVYSERACLSHGEYVVYKKPKDITDNELLLIFDQGNLCFGGTKVTDIMYRVNQD